MTKPLVYVQKNLQNHVHWNRQSSLLRIPEFSIVTYLGDSENYLSQILPLFCTVPSQRWNKTATSLRRPLFQCGIRLRYGFDARDTLHCKRVPITIGRIAVHGP